MAKIGTRFRVSQLNYPTDTFTLEDKKKQMLLSRSSTFSAYYTWSTRGEKGLTANTDLENLLYHTLSLKFCKMGLVILLPHPEVLGDQMHPRL